jgi:hypothetical protein
MMKKLMLFGLLSVGLAVQLMAQFPPRVEDHFWRRKVINRIDLAEKINQPLIQRESNYYKGELNADTVGPQNKDGLVVALFEALERGDIQAYHPDTLSRELTAREVFSRANSYSATAVADGEAFPEDGGTGEGDGMADAAPIDPFAPVGDDGSDPSTAPSEDPFADPFAPAPDPFAPEPGSEPGPEPGSEPGSEPADMGANEIPNTIPYETVMHFVEDRIFDKNRSDMVYDIQYIELIWVDPYGSIEDKRLCTFRYEDVLSVLENTQWKNRFNDAQYRSMREVFEMRLFHSYIIDISGEGIQSLSEAEYRRQQLVEFEHHLWSY